MSEAITCELRDATLITFYPPDNNPELPEVDRLYGTCIVDYRGRFAPGWWVFTTAVESIDGNLVRTHSGSRYWVEGGINRDRMPYDWLPLVSQGLDRDQIVELLEMMASHNET